MSTPIDLTACKSSALPPDGAVALETDLTELINRMNRAGDKSLVVRVNTWKW
jgi:hypothetical protein